MEAVLIALIAGATVASSMYAQALSARKARGRSGGRFPGDAQVDVRMVLEELDALRSEVAELAERLDFAERVLARQREEPRIAPPDP